RRRRRRLHRQRRAEDRRVHAEARRTFSEERAQAIVLWPPGCDPRRRRIAYAAQETRSPLAQWRGLLRLERRGGEEPRQRGRTRLCQRRRSRHRHGVLRYDLAHFVRPRRGHRCRGRSRSQFQRRRQGTGGGFVTVTRSVILGCGSYLPTRVLSNDDLAKMVDTSDAWIFERTGIRRRHVASEGEMTSDLALEAARRALKQADMAASDLDLVIVAT